MRSVEPVSIGRRGSETNALATELPLSVAWYSVAKAQPQPEDTVVVIGAGMIGLCVVQALRAWGVSQIIVSGRRPKRLQLAKQCGADRVVDAAREDVVAVVREMSLGSDQADRHDISMLTPKTGCFPALDAPFGGRNGRSKERMNPEMPLLVYQQTAPLGLECTIDLDRPSAPCRTKLTC